MCLQYKRTFWRFLRENLPSDEKIWSYSLIWALNIWLSFLHCDLGQFLHFIYFTISFEFTFMCVCFTFVFIFDPVLPCSLNIMQSWESKMTAPKNMVNYLHNIHTCDFPQCMSWTFTMPSQAWCVNTLQCLQKSTWNQNWAYFPD